MQKRSKKSYSVSYSPEGLPDDFPILSGGTFIQTDRPITTLHRHNYLEIGFCYEGTGIFIVDDKMMNFTGGDIAVINRREMHLAASTRDTTSTWVFVMVDPERLLAGTGDREYAFSRSDDLAGSDFNNIIKGELQPVLCGTVRRLIDELHGEAPGYRSLVTGMMWDIMIQLHRLLPEQREVQPVAPGRMEAVAPALGYCARNYRAPVRVTDLSSLCNMSEPHFRRVFKTVTGHAPLEYLNRYRIRTACALLETTDKRIIDISLETGFETLSSFNRQFRKVMGCAPREWRKGNVK